MPVAGMGGANASRRKLWQRVPPLPPPRATPPSFTAVYSVSPRLEIQLSTLSPLPHVPPKSSFMLFINIYINHTTHFVWKSRVFLHYFRALKLLGGKAPERPVRMLGRGAMKLTKSYATYLVSPMYFVKVSK